MAPHQTRVASITWKVELFASVQPNRLVGSWGGLLAMPAPIDTGHAPHHHFKGRFWTERCVGGNNYLKASLTCNSNTNKLLCLVNKKKWCLGGLEWPETSNSGPQTASNYGCGLCSRHIASNSLNASCKIMREVVNRCL